jgi:hypothetical protein
MEKFYNWFNNLNNGIIIILGNPFAGEHQLDRNVLIGYKLQYLLECGYKGELTVDSALDNSFLDQLIERHGL